MIGIKGFDMPNSCGECKFFNQCDAIDCEKLIESSRQSGTRPDFTIRQPNCPLVEEVYNKEEVIEMFKQLQKNIENVKLDKVMGNKYTVYGVTRKSSEDIKEECETIVKSYVDTLIIREDTTLFSSDKDYRKIYGLEYCDPCGEEGDYKSCELCRFRNNCTTAWDDDFDLTTKEELIDRLRSKKNRLENPLSEKDISIMKKVLKEFYDYDFEE